MLAGADTVLTIDGAALRLRPSLRAALRLERQFGGFAGLLKTIDEGSVSALVTLAVECGEAHYEAVILAPSPEAWNARFERIAPQLVALVFDLADVDPQAADKPRIERPGDQCITLAEALEQSFGIATGILGWSPAAAWSATPAEIKAALDQHLRMLRAQHGLPDPDSEDDDPFAERSDNASLASLASLSKAG